MTITTPAFAASVFSASGDDPASIQGTVDAFRTALGALNAPEPVNAAGGRRQINWDAAPDAVSDPNDFPGDFFNTDFAPRARGISFEATGSTTSFLLSSTLASGVQTAFGFSGEFGVFSPERLFSPVGGTTFEATFHDPTKPDEPALSRGLGVVFSGVDDPSSTSLEFRDINGDVIDVPGASASGKLFAEVGKLAFLGIVFDESVIASVSIKSGDADLFSNGLRNSSGDSVVMDDFIFGEPTPVAPVPLPAAVWFLIASLGGLGFLGARRQPV